MLPNPFLNVTYSLYLTYSTLKCCIMKKLLALCAIFFAVQVGIAQERVQNQFVKQGDHIVATLYHDNGVIAQTGFYTLDNKLEGEWISYDALGNKTAVAHYKDGEKVGTWFFYQGDEIKEVKYDESRIAQVTSFKVSDTRVVTY